MPRLSLALWVFVTPNTVCVDCALFVHKCRILQYTHWLSYKSSVCTIFLWFFSIVLSTPWCPWVGVSWYCSRTNCRSFADTYTFPWNHNSLSLYSNRLSSFGSFSIICYAKLSVSNAFWICSSHSWFSTWNIANSSLRLYSIVPSLLICNTWSLVFGI